MGFDKFELIVKVHRFFSLTYYGYYPTEKKCKFIFCSLNQLIIFAIILCLSSPCLLIDFNCSDTKRTQHWLGFRQLIIFMIVRNSIAIISSIIYSIKGSIFRQIIEDLRKLFNGLNKNQIKKSNAINLVLILTIFQIIFVIIALVFTFHRGTEIPFFKVIILLISDKEHSRSGGSVLGKCIYFWKVLVETSSTVYIIAAPIEVKGQKSGGSTFGQNSIFYFLRA
jgi:hypothetical protein